MNWRKAAKLGKLAIGKAVTLKQMELSRVMAQNTCLKIKVEILKKGS